MGISLYKHQLEAVEKMHNGSILCGAVGTGKSITALAYYLKDCGGSIPINNEGSWGDMKSPRDLYIITTAKKRDSNEWALECGPFGFKTNVVVDSWNNIQKYVNVYNAFFIFDEQRVVGKGAWVKAFLKITRKNRWVLLSATPGDTWSDYIPVFIANGFYRNKTEFNSEHCVFNPYLKYPKIDRYVNTWTLVRYRNQILVNMKFEKQTIPHHIVYYVDYDKKLYSTVFRDRWDPFDKCPIQETGKLCYLMRKVVNLHQSRIDAVKELLLKHDRAIIFYNYDYELDVLRSIAKEMNITSGEWNGQKHEEVPVGERWVYLVQYNAGSEGWNCITTDTTIFYSQTYSYRMSVQAAGRIDRLNTKYKDLYFYHIRSMAPIDIAISRSLKCKKNFNEKAFLGI